MYKIQLLIIEFDRCYNVKSLKISVKIWLIKKNVLLLISVKKTLINFFN